MCASSAIFEENSSVLLYNFSDPRGGWQGAPCLGVLYDCKQTLGVQGLGCFGGRMIRPLLVCLPLAACHGALERGLAVVF